MAEAAQQGAPPTFKLVLVGDGGTGKASEFSARSFVEFCGLDILSGRHILDWDTVFPFYVDQFPLSPPSTKNLFTQVGSRLSGIPLLTYRLLCRPLSSSVT